jgi:hypothetical protein
MGRAASVALFFAWSTGKWARTMGHVFLCTDHVFLCTDHGSWVKGLEYAESVSVIKVRIFSTSYYITPYI